MDDRSPMSGQVRDSRLHISLRLTHQVDSSWTWTYSCGLMLAPDQITRQAQFAVWEAPLPRPPNPLFVRITLSGDSPMVTPKNR
jgi:hypothetical protein